MISTVRGIGYKFKETRRSLTCSGPRFFWKLYLAFAVLVLVTMASPRATWSSEQLGQDATLLERRAEVRLLDMADIDDPVCHRRVREALEHLVAGGSAVGGYRYQAEVQARDR